MGHVLVPHDREKDPWGPSEGCCPSHRGCLEGLASGPAIARRWGSAAHELPDVHPAWELEAGYLAQGLVSIINILAPGRIVLGGGVMERQQLYPLILHKVMQLIGGYLPVKELSAGMDSYIVAPVLGQRSGVLGAMALALGLDRGEDTVDADANVSAHTNVNTGANTNANDGSVMEQGI